MNIKYKKLNLIIKIIYIIKNININGKYKIMYYKIKSILIEDQTNKP